MDDSTFNALTDKQLYEGFKHCCESAEAHVNCADAMEKTKLYGLANSHLILGVEEAIKGLLILNRLLRVDIPIKSIEPYFKYHQEKHKQGKSMTLDIENHGLIADFPIIFTSVVGYFAKKLSDSDMIKLGFEFAFIRPLENEWWKKANDQKNAGFYVDYFNANWQAPSHLSMDDYLRSKQQTKRLYGYIHLFAKLLDGENIQDLPPRDNVAINV